MSLLAINSKGDLVDLVSCLNDNKVIGIKDTIEAKHAVNLQYANINFIRKSIHANLSKCYLKSF